MLRAKALKLVVTAGTTPASSFKWIEFLARTTLLRGQKSRFRLLAIPSGASTLEKWG